MCDEYEFILASIGGLGLKRPKPIIIHPYQRRCVTWRDVIETDVIGVLHGSTDHIPSFIKIEALELPNLNWIIFLKDLLSTMKGYFIALNFLLLAHNSHPLWNTYFFSLESQSTYGAR